MKQALVTGASGFVGRHMCETLRGEYALTEIDCETGDDALDFFYDFPDGLTYDLVVHAAARGPNRQAIDTDHGAFPYNVMLDAAMFEWAIRTRQSHVVYLSSSAVYPADLQGTSGWRTTADRGHLGDRRLYEAQARDGAPHDVYGWTKLTGECLADEARKAGVRVTVVRPFSGYGEDQSEDFPFGAFVARARRQENPFIIWGSADQVRDFVHIDDICAAILALTHVTSLKPVNICTGVGTTMLQLAKLVCREAGYVPAFQIDTDAPLGVHYRVGDPSHLHKIYTPKITIEEGVKRAFQLR